MILYPEWIAYVGLGAAMGGVILLEFVHQALGEHFSPHLELRNDHKIVTTGPYRYVRHPMYSSGLLFLVGLGLFSHNIVVLLFPTGSFLILLLLRIRDEEKMLHERFGDEWHRYTQITGAIIPRLIRK